MFHSDCLVILKDKYVCIAPSLTKNAKLYYASPHTSPRLIPSIPNPIPKKHSQKMQHCPISPALASFYNEYHNAALVSAQHDLKACQTLIGYTFNNINLLFEALQAPGTIALSATGHPLKRGNENLAIVGDLALAAVLSAEWYRTDNTSTGNTSHLLYSFNLSDHN